MGAHELMVPDKNDHDPRTGYLSVNNNTTKRCRIVKDNIGNPFAQNELSINGFFSRMKAPLSGINYFKKIDENSCENKKGCGAFNGPTVFFSQKTFFFREYFPHGWLWSKVNC